MCSVPDSHESQTENIEKQWKETWGRQEEIMNEFISATIDFVRSLYWSRTESCVKNAHDRTMELGVEKVSALKEEIRRLQSRADEIVVKYIGTLWWHRYRREGSLRFTYFYARDIEQNLGMLLPPGPLDEAIGKAVNEVSPILEKYGYVPPTKSNDYLFWTEPMKKLANEYESLLLKLFELEGEYKKSTSADLWNNAK